MKSESLERPLIIGSTGCLGQSMQKLMLSAGIQLDFSFENQFKEEFRTKQSFLVKVDDIRSRNYSSVIYLAQSRRYKEYPAGLAELNLLNNSIPLRFADVCAELEIPFVYCSTGSVYQPTSHLISESSPLVEDNRLSAYVASKLLADQSLCKRLESQHLLILRPFYIYGDGARKPSLFPSLVENILAKKEITLHGSDGLEFKPISSFDAASALIYLLSRKFKGIFNLSGIETVTLREVSSLIGEHLNVNVDFVVNTGIQQVLNDQSKLLSTGFQYSTTFVDSFTSYIAGKR
jgi:nucleoside-diphosphate-sugar epimerase